jgi:hypothetical protein
MIGKENVLAAMRSGAKLFIGGHANFNRLKFDDGSIERVHGRTVQAVLDTGLVRPFNLQPWSPMSTEYVLKEED